MGIREGAVLADRYELETRLATGGMGEIFRAYDLDVGEPVAVKVLRPDIAGGAQRFADEVATLEKLNHPNIVRLLGAGEHEGVPFLVMELVPGKPLDQTLQSRRLSLEELRRLGIEIASALAYAHERGVVNRDVNPGNILYDEHDVAKLADFGIALLSGTSRITETDITIGSAAYLAPEQITHDPIGPPADVYALGLVLIEAHTGEVAYQGPLKEAAIARLARDAEVPEDLPAPWRRLLALMTSRDPGARPTANEVAAMLESTDW